MRVRRKARVALALLPALCAGYGLEARAEEAPDAPAAEIRLEPQVAPRSLSLQDAMKLALERNPGLTSNQLDVVLARLAEERARLDRFSASIDVSLGDTGGLVIAPGSSATFGGSDGSSSGSGYSATWSNGLVYGAGATLSVPLYTGGAVTAQIQRSTLNVKSSQLDLALAQRDLIRAVYQSYWNIQGFDLQRAATEESLKQSREALTVIQAKLTNGLAAPIELNRFQVDVLSQEQRLAELELQAYKARQGLLQLLHLEGEDLTLTDIARESQAGAPAETAAALMEKAHRQRIELESLSLAIEGSAYDRLIATAGFKPYVSLDLTMQAGAQPEWYKSEVVDTFPDSTLAPGLSMSAGVNLKWNLFNLYKTTYQVKQVDVVVSRLKAQQVVQTDSIDVQVKNAHQQLMNLRRRAGSVTRQLELARDNLTIIQSLYSQGSATILDLFDAQSAYRNALSQEATQRIDLTLADYELRWTVGEGLIETK